MRRVVTALMGYAREGLITAGASPQRLQESRDMFEFMDASLSGLNLNQLGGYDGPETKFGEVMTTADFPYALGEFVRRQMIPGYNRKGFMFEPLIAPRVVPNYMSVTEYQDKQGTDDLEYTPAGAPPKAGSRADADKKQFRVVKWQKQWDFLMEMLVNDDLGYFTTQATKMGVSARRTKEKFVSRMMTNATTIARLVALGVNYSTTGQLTTARISAARMGFAQRVDAINDPIIASLKYIVHPSALIDQVKTIQSSTLVPELATNANNVVAGSFTSIENPYMTAPTGAPNWPWFAFVDPASSGIDAMILVSRNGMPAPILTRKRSDQEVFSGFGAAGTPLPAKMGDFANGTVTVKVWDEWGTYIDGTQGNLYDFRGAYYSSGVTP